MGAYINHVDSKGEGGKATERFQEEAMWANNDINDFFAIQFCQNYK